MKTPYLLYLEGDVRGKRSFRVKEASTKSGNKKVVIIGAGPAGLTATHEISKAGGDTRFYKSERC